MAKREVTVVINGQETVSEATSSADASLGGFVGKIPGWAKAVTLLAAAYTVVSNAIGMAKDYVLDAIGAYDRFAASQTKLGAQSKLTGIALDDLNKIADTARDRFGLSSVVANDAATTVGKYASRAGEAAKANELLARALDLGAASGLTAAQTMEALEQGLRGQDEGFDKLLGKNPSAIWKEYADANGLAVGKMDDTTKRLAEITALMEAGEKVAGAYSDRTESGAGAQDRLNNALEDAKVKFGQAIQPARIFITQGLVTLVDWGGRVVLALGRISNVLIVTFTGALAGATSIVGDLAIGLGKLTRNEELENWGRRQSTAFSEFREQVAKLEAKYLTTATAATTSATQQEAANKKVGDSLKATAETAEQAATRLNKTLDDKLGRPMQVVIGMTEGAIQKLSDAARDQLPPETAEKFVGHMQDLATKAAQSRDNMIGLSSKTSEASKSTKNTADDIARVARSALDAAVAFGVIEASAANTLNSVINIASGIAGVVTGDATSGVAAILTGITNVVASMLGGAAETRRLMRMNNEALSKLSRDIGGLKLNVTESDINSARTALGSVIGQLRGGRGAANETDVRNALEANGLSMGDLNRIAQELGITIRTSSGALNVEAVGALLQALGTTRVGRLGSDFNSQLDFFREGQRLDGASGTGAVNGLLDFLRNIGGVTALNGLDASDPAALRAALRQMITQLNNGQGVEGLGRLTGSQFMDLLVSIIGDLDEMMKPGTDGGASSGGDVVVPSGNSGGAGPVSVPTATIQDVIKAMDTNVGGILTAHTALHERIAVATEGSYQRLTSIDAKMDMLIAATEGQIARVDQELERSRRLTALERGVLPELR